MRQRTVLSFAALVFALVPNARGEDKGSKPDPLRAIQGEWTVTCLGFAGYELRTTAEQPMKVTFSQDRVTIRPAYYVNYLSTLSFGRGRARTERTTSISLSDQGHESTFRLDPGKTPGEIDLEEKDDKNKTVRVQKGIYRLTGDELELCIGLARRPGDFKATTAGVLLRLKRKAAKD